MWLKTKVKENYTLIILLEISDNKVLVEEGMKLIISVRDGVLNLLFVYSTNQLPIVTFSTASSLTDRKLLPDPRKNACCEISIYNDILFHHYHLPSTKFSAHKGLVCETLFNDCKTSLVLIVMLHIKTLNCRSR